MQEKISWNEKTWEKGFAVFYKEIQEAFSSFYVWKALQKKEYNKIFEKNGYFWSSVLGSLKTDFLIRLARAYEDSRFTKKDGSVFSAYSICSNIDLPEAKSILDKNKDLLHKLGDWRDQTLMHNDINPKLPKIKNGDIEKIFGISKKLLPLLDPNKREFLFNSFQGSLEKDVKKVILSLKKSKLL